MRKIMTVVGTRPELIKMSRVIYEMDRSMQHIFVHTGQNDDYTLNQIFFEDLDIRKPDYFLNANTGNAIKTISIILQETDKILEKENPDALLLYGDTHSCLSVIAAKKRKIPIFHMEAGNRCFDQRVPEEINRKIVDHLSDINIVLTEHARRYLIMEGIRPETIIKSGSHLQEVLDYYMPKIKSSTILNQLSLSSKKYFLISAHRAENVDYQENFLNFLASLNQIAKTYNLPIIVSTHPRMQERLKNSGFHSFSEQIHFLKPFCFSDYIYLQLNAFCILSDSGTITEEASLLDLPAIIIRNVHERPEGMDEGAIIMSGLQPDHIWGAIQIVTRQHRESKTFFKLAPDYEGGLISKKIVNIVLSYIDYINRVVWSK